MNKTDFTHEQIAASEPKLTESQLTSLGLKLRGKFTENETLRQPYEQIWLEDTRMLNGIYDPDTLKLIGKVRSTAYPKIARSKTVSVEARLHEIIDPDIGKPWSISPSPEATIPAEAMQMIVDGLVKQSVEKWEAEQAERAGMIQRGVAAIGKALGLNKPTMPDDATVQAAFDDYAKKACQGMETEIDDQLLDTKFPEKRKKALRSGLHLGTGVIKGPLVTVKETKKWKPVNGQYVLDTRSVNRPYLEDVRLWDWYPDMTATDIDQCEGFFQRHVMTKHEVRKLAKRGDFNADVINDYLRVNPDGDCVFKTWELELQSITSEEGQQKKGRKYEVLEYWGYADARDLEECGVTVPEEKQGEELQVNVWLLGDKVIKAVLNGTPKEEQPYHVFYFEKDETSIFGKGIPRIMRDSQVNLCAAWRMALDNGAICCGPQIEVNTDLLDDDQDLESIRQFKIWYRDGTGNSASFPAIKIHDVESHIPEYLQIIKQCLDFADLETAFPTYMLIEPASAGNETAQGASIRSGTVNITVKDIAKNFDDFNSGILEGLYAWNMEFNEDESIKGDYAVEAKGASSLVAKEVRAQILTQNAVLIEKYQAWIPEYEYLKELFKAMDMPVKLRTQEEHDMWIQQNTDPEALQQRMDMVQAQINEIRSKALKNVAMAKKQNVSAINEAAGSEGGQETPVPPAPVTSPEETAAKIQEIHSKTVKNLTAAHKDEVAAEMLKKQPTEKENKG